MRSFSIALVVLSLVAIAGPLQAQLATVSNTFVYAYPGTTCPGGSDPYMGPEQEMAKASGAVYCRFTRKIMVIPKSQSKECPSGTKAYKKEGLTPPQGINWCETDPDYKMVIPPMPAQPSKPSSPQ